ncbi:glutaminase liver isoform, mitochondrial isoform X1 [Paramormyrops kingsleyae]|uniref:glutaminase liver isoform, mitochondrial isoform X1 n=2 Tax=Paramormyrops kingsleyae TaxID=1676925 RepID=UPI003B96E974
MYANLDWLTHTRESAYLPMENIPHQDHPEENSYLCFQRTPSLRRKWRKRYGGLDGNKLLEPNTEDDSTENGSVNEPHQDRNFPQTQSPESLVQARATTVNPSLKSQNAVQPQMPIKFVTPGSIGKRGSCDIAPVGSPMVTNGRPGKVGPQREQAGNPTPFWHSFNRLDPQQAKRKGTADVLFESFASEGRVNTSRLFEAIWRSGIRKTDPRIIDCHLLMTKLQAADGTVNRDAFHRSTTGFVSFIVKALQGRFIIPDFPTFTEETQKLFLKTKQLDPVKQGPGNEASWKWGVSICTVDGQRLSLGDCMEPFLLEALSWPFVYGMAVDQLGVDYVHRYVGVEEFSKYDSPFTLTKQGMPHSPLIVTGAIITASLLQLPARVEAEEEKYDSVLNTFRRLCNKEHTNLNCTSYQNLKKESVRLHSLSFYLQEKKCFPESVDINAAVDLIQQCSSTEVTCESGAVMAATLANGGLCPLSGDQVLSPSSARAMLSMMQVAGMNDYSRLFHFKTSVPAKSSKSGSLLVAVPGVLGIMCWSPELDAFANSWKAVHFCEELVSTFQLHSFDIRTPFRQVVAYRQWKAESEGYQIMNILLAAYRGDVQSLRRYFLSGVDMNAVDYDGRSALHIAASQGQTEAAKFLIENAGASISVRDRWGTTPLQDAVRSNHSHMVQMLQKSEG